MNTRPYAKTVNTNLNVNYHEYEKVIGHVNKHVHENNEHKDIKGHVNEYLHDIEHKNLNENESELRRKRKRKRTNTQI